MISVTVPGICSKSSLLITISKTLAGACGLPASAADGLARLATLAISRLFEVGVSLDVFEQTFLHDQPLEDAQRRFDPAVVDHDGQRMPATGAAAVGGPLAITRTALAIT